MKDPLTQLLRGADANAAPPPRRTSSRAIADAVRLRRRREQVRMQIVTVACTLIAVTALGFSLRQRDASETEIAKAPAPPAAPDSPTDTRASKAAIAQLDIDAEVADLTARRLMTSEAKHRVSPARPTAAAAIDIQEQRDRAALVLIYEGDGYASRRQGNDAIAAWQRTIALFPQSHWADVARQRLKDYST